MKFKKLASIVAVSAAFGLMACDDTTSAVSAADEKPASSASIVKEETPASSDQKSDAPASSSSSTETKEDVSSSSKIDMGEISDIVSNLGDLDLGDFEMPECEKAGDTIQQVVMGQTIPLVCGEDGEVAPAVSISDIINNMDDETLQPVLDSLGMTKEELEAMIKIIEESMNNQEENGDSLMTTPKVQCTGSLEDNTWKMDFSTSVFGKESKGSMSQTWEGTTATEVSYSETDMGSAIFCKTALKSTTDEEDDELDENTVVEEKCDGSKFIHKETTVIKDVDSDTRSEMYQEFQDACKAYENGISTLM